MQAKRDAGEKRCRRKEMQSEGIVEEKEDVFRLPTFPRVLKEVSTRSKDHFVAS